MRAEPNPSAWPFTARFRGVALLERDIFLETLNSLLDDARDGNGRVAVVRGEAGIGKTSLVNAFVDLANESAHVLIGRCDDLLTARPLGPLWDMAFDEPSLEELLAAGDRLETFRSVQELLARSLRPTVLVFEDVHWADAATLDLIKFLGRRVDRTHGLIVLTFRDGEASGDQPLHLALGDLPHGTVERLPLPRLSREAVAEMAGGVESDELYEITNGNPFFVTEAVSTPGSSVPSSVLDAVGSRVLRLSSEARHLVEICSVVPGRVELELVDHLLEDSGPAIEEATVAGLLNIDGGQLAFRHELARRAIEVGLTEVHRRGLNQQVLDGLEKMNANLSRRAHHAREAGNVELMLVLLPAAAKRATELESHREAYSHLSALYDIRDRMSQAELADYLDRLAYEQYLADEGGGKDAIEAAIDLRRELGDPAKLGASLLTASRIFWVDNQGAIALDRATEASQLLDAGDDHMAMAYSTLSQLAMLANEGPETIAYAEKALAINGDKKSRARAHALNNIGSIRMMSSYPDGLKELEESFGLSGELGLPHDQTRAAVNIAWGALFFHDLDVAESWIDRGLEVIRRSEMPTFESYLLAEETMLLEMRGEWAEALEKCQAILQSDPILGTTRISTSIVRARILARTGEPEAVEALVKAWDESQAINEIQRVGPIAAAVSEFIALGGQLDHPNGEELAAVVEKAVGLDVRPFVGEIAQWLLIAGVIDQIPSISPFPYRALAEGDWQSAASYWDEHNMPYDRAVALSRGDDQARVEALKIFDRLGAVVAASTLRSELQKSGLKGIPRKPRKSTRESPMGLTARQAEVLELLAGDMTNAEIADRLFLSTRTVDHHVAAILSKLGAENRSEAVDSALASGLLGEVVP